LPRECPKESNEAGSQANKRQKTSPGPLNRDSNTEVVKGDNNGFGACMINGGGSVSSVKPGEKEEDENGKIDPNLEEEKSRAMEVHEKNSQFKGVPVIQYSNGG